MAPRALELIETLELLPHPVPIVSAIVTNHSIFVFHYALLARSGAKTLAVPAALSLFLAPASRALAPLTVELALESRCQANVIQA